MSGNRTPPQKPPRKTPHPGPGIRDDEEYYRDKSNDNPVGGIRDDKEYYRDKSNDNPVGGIRDDKEYYRDKSNDNPVGGIRDDKEYYKVQPYDPDAPLPRAPRRKRKAESSLEPWEIRLKKNLNASISNYEKEWNRTGKPSNKNGWRDVAATLLQEYLNKYLPYIEDKDHTVKKDKGILGKAAAWFKRDIHNKDDREFAARMRLMLLDAKNTNDSDCFNKIKEYQEILVKSPELQKSQSDMRALCDCLVNKIGKALSKNESPEISPELGAGAGAGAAPRRKGT